MAVDYIDDMGITGVESASDLARAVRRRTMSTWMSIGFDPDQMDATTETNTQVAVSGARDDAAPRQTDGLDRRLRANAEPSAA